ncbi:MAG: AsmA family protein [Elusimicrobia bacterium]|nr:AsmA family protein [Elusimicrobiota bacterium]
MNKYFKILAWLAGAFCLALVAVIIAVQIYFPQEKRRKMALDLLTQRLHREVQLDSVSLAWSGVKINGLSVSELPDFSKGTMFKTDSVHVTFRLLPLLEKKIEIGKVSVDGLALNVLRDAKGQFNFSDLMASSAAPSAAGQPSAKAETAAPSGLSVTVSRFSLEDSSLVMKDEAIGYTASLSDVNLQADNIALDKPFDLSLSMKADYKSKPFSAALPLEAELSFNPASGDMSKMSADIKKLKLALGKLNASVAGKVSDMSNPSGSLTLKTEPVNSSDLKAFLPQLPGNIPLPAMALSSDFAMGGGYSSITLKNAKIKAGPVSASASGQASWNGPLAYSFNAELDSSLPAFSTDLLAAFSKSVPAGIKVPETSLKASASVTPSAIEVKNFAFKAGKTIQASGKAFASQQNAKWSAKASFSTGQADLSETAEIMPDLKQYAPEGTASASVDVTYSPTALNYSGTASLKKVGGKFMNYVMKGLDGSVAFTDSSIKAQGLRGSVNKADFTAMLSSTYSLAQKTATVNADLDVGEVDINSFMPPAALVAAGGASAGKGAAPAAKPAPIDFTLNLDLNAKAKRMFYPNFEAKETKLACSIRNMNPSALGRMNGNASFSINGGAFQDLAALGQRSTIARMLLFPITVLQKASRLVKINLFPNFDNVNYKSIEGKYRIVNGVVNIEKSQLLSDIADVDSTGNLNLPTEAIDMKITAKISAISTKGAPLTVPMTVSGTMSNPKTSVSVVELAKTEAAKTVVKEGVQNLLKGLFK